MHAARIGSIRFKKADAIYRALLALRADPASAPMHYPDNCIRLNEQLTSNQGGHIVMPGELRSYYVPNDQRCRDMDPPSDVMDPIGTAQPHLGPDAPPSPPSVKAAAPSSRPEGAPPRPGNSPSPEKPGILKPPDAPDKDNIDATPVKKSAFAGIPLRSAPGAPPVKECAPVKGLNAEAAALATKLTSMRKQIHSAEADIIKAAGMTPGKFPANMASGDKKKNWNTMLMHRNQVGRAITKLHNQHLVSIQPGKGPQRKLQQKLAALDQQYKAFWAQFESVREHDVRAYHAVKAGAAIFTKMSTVLYSGHATVNAANMSAIFEEMAGYLAKGMEDGEAVPQGPDYHALYFNHCLVGASDALLLVLKLVENSRAANEVNQIRTKWAAVFDMQECDKHFEALRVDIDRVLDAIVKEVMPRPSTIPYGSIL